jgi:NTP pyrophosphatase (non-canonical NTP hydrolase)
MEESWLFHWTEMLYRPVKTSFSISRTGIEPEHHFPMTIEEITAEIRHFRDERDWKQFHNPKDMAIAISLEAGELLEHFLWIEEGKADERASQRRDAIAQEIADIAIFLFELAENLGIDLGSAIRQKLEHNATKYPVHKAKGRSDKYNEL